MSRAERILVSLIVLAGLLVLAALGVRWYGSAQYQAGYNAAIADGKEQYDRDAATARKTESDLRGKLRAQDADALKKKEEYEANLETAQRRVRTGTERLLCPGTISVAAAADDRLAAGGPGADGEGPAIVPEVAAEILGDGADVAGLVRRYDRVVQRFEACRAVNAGP